ncbi:uncharacterized protein LOC131447853 [Solea solea]|uniref:uncharacterized protein LOC131447853 n=1 Tax=Solea solea TaxID=90069 RepID=UPI00272C678F|nr:uncharacterized protein LOC131447853 [Solea solea]
MSGTVGAAPPTAVIGLGLDIGGPCHVQKSGTLGRTCLLTSSVQPASPAGGGNRGSRAPLRLPSLKASARGRGRRGSMARLSLSEPSLLTLNENIPFDGFSNIQWPGVLQKRHPPPPPTFSKSPALLSSKTWHPPLSSSHNCSSRPTSTYIHFSQAIQPSTRSRRHSHNRTLSVDTATQLRDFSSQRELLSVIGKPCLPSCSQRSAPGPAPGPASGPAPGPAAGPGRTQLHVFLPTEVEGEEVDSESVDEGFMDELDSKITSLKLQ